MENFVILKWGSLKAYNFGTNFYNKHKKIVDELEKIWDEIYENNYGAIGGSDKLQNKQDLKIKLINTLEQIYNLGVPFQNGFTDEHYNNFKEIKDYILNYGK